MPKPSNRPKCFYLAALDEVEFDEKLHHYADQRIEIDLADGVKHNYGLFGDLLAEVKAVTGEKPRFDTAHSRNSP